MMHDGHLTAADAAQTIGLYGALMTRPYATLLAAVMSLAMFSYKWADTVLTYLHDHPKHFLVVAAVAMLIAIYSSLLELQNTLDSFQLDVKQDSLREVVYEAIKDAVEEHLTEGDKAQMEKDEELRAEGKPATAFEAYQMATQRNTDAINKFNHNSDVIKKQYKNISDLLCELLGRENLFPYEKPEFKDENGCAHIAELALSVPLVLLQVLLLQQACTRVFQDCCMVYLAD